MSIHPELLLRQVRLLRRLRRVRASFDDAFRSAATVFPELEVLGVPIQIFACTGYARNGAPLEIPEFGGDDLGQLATMTWDDLRAHAERGVTISSHGVSHAHLTQLSDNEVRRELTESKQELEDRLGRACSDFAYPYGEHDERVRQRGADLAEEDELVHGDRRLAATRLRRSAGDADDVSEVDVDITRARRVAEELNAAAAVDEVEEDELPHLSAAKDAPRCAHDRVRFFARFDPLGLRADALERNGVGEALRSHQPASLSSALNGLWRR